MSVTDIMEKDYRDNENRFIGRRGEYELIGQLGKGGMSAVYRVKAAGSDGESYVLKRALCGRGNNAALMQLENEAEIMREISKKMEGKIPGLIDIGGDFLVMEEVKGKPLNTKNRTFREIVDICLKLCDIFILLHEVGSPVVYRDLKPGNIMEKKDGSLLLIDFGCAGRLENYQGRNLGKVLISGAGTKSYAAPEQFGAKLGEDFLTDVYQFGKLLEEMIRKGKLGFIERRLLKGIAGRCTAPRKADRPCSFSEIKRMLLQIKVRLKREYLKMGMVIALLVVVGAFTVFFTACAIREFVRDDFYLLRRLGEILSDFLLSVKQRHSGMNNSSFSGIILDRLVTPLKELGLCGRRMLGFSFAAIILERIFGVIYRRMMPKSAQIVGKSELLTDIVMSVDSIEIM